MNDITLKFGEPVEIKIREDSKVIWINVNETCVLRICGIEKLVVEDERKHSQV